MKSISCDMKTISCKSKFLAAILKNNLFLALHYWKCLTKTLYYHFLVFLPRNTIQHGYFATTCMEMWKITNIYFIFNSIKHKSMIQYTTAVAPLSEVPDILHPSEGRRGMFPFLSPTLLLPTATPLAAAQTSMHTTTEASMAEVASRCMNKPSLTSWVRKVAQSSPGSPTCTSSGEGACHWEL